MWYSRRRNQWTLWNTVIVLALCTMLSAQEQAPMENGASEGETRQTRPVPLLASESIISPDDVLDIYVLDVPELSRQYRVSPAGTVMLPLLPEPLSAADRSPSEFAETVAQQLRQKGLVSNPHVIVSIVSSRVKSVAVTGAVKRPQIYPIFGRTTLLDVLSQAEGLDQDASNLAIISRGELGRHAMQSSERTQTVDLKKLMESGDPAYNVDIYPGDRVTVPRAGIVYVVGAVHRPGGFSIKNSGEGITALQALALAEDLKSTAIRDKAQVIRVDPNARNGRKQIPLDLKRVLEGKEDDPVLQANDILFIPDSQGAKAFRRGLEAVLQTATGLAIYRR